MSEDPALGQKNVHAPACLVWLLFIGWKVEIMVNLLRKLFRLFESWSLLLVKHGQSKNVKSSGPKRKTIKHAQVSKNIFTVPGPFLLPFLPGAGLLLHYLHVAGALLLLEEPWLLSSQSWPGATHSSSSTTLLHDSR